MDFRSVRERVLSASAMAPSDRPLFIPSAVDFGHISAEYQYVAAGFPNVTPSYGYLLVKELRPEFIPDGDPRAQSARECNYVHRSAGAEYGSGWYGKDRKNMVKYVPPPPHRPFQGFHVPHPSPPAGFEHYPTELRRGDIVRRGRDWPSGCYDDVFEAPTGGDYQTEGRVVFVGERNIYAANPHREVHIEWLFNNDGREQTWNATTRLYDSRALRQVFKVDPANRLSYPTDLPRAPVFRPPPGPPPPPPPPPAPARFEHYPTELRRGDIVRRGRDWPSGCHDDVFEAPTGGDYQTEGRVVFVGERNVYAANPHREVEIEWLFNNDGREQTWNATTRLYDSRAVRQVFKVDPANRLSYPTDLPRAPVFRPPPGPPPPPPPPPAPARFEHYPTELRPGDIVRRGRDWPSGCNDDLRITPSGEEYETEGRVVMIGERNFHANTPCREVRIEWLFDNGGVNEPQNRTTRLYDSRALRQVFRVDPASRQSYPSDLPRRPRFKPLRPPPPPPPPPPPARFEHYPTELRPGDIVRRGRDWPSGCYDDVFEAPGASCQLEGRVVSVGGRNIQIDWFFINDGREQSWSWTTRLYDSRALRQVFKVDPANRQSYPSDLPRAPRFAPPPPPPPPPPVLDELPRKNDVVEYKRARQGDWVRAKIEDVKWNKSSGNYDFYLDLTPGGELTDITTDAVRLRKHQIPSLRSAGETFSRGETVQYQERNDWSPAQWLDATILHIAPSVGDYKLYTIEFQRRKIKLSIKRDQVKNHLRPVGGERVRGDAPPPPNNPQMRPGQTSSERRLRELQQQSEKLKKELREQEEELERILKLTRARNERVPSSKFRGKFAGYSYDEVRGEYFADRWSETASNSSRLEALRIEVSFGIGLKTFIPTEFYFGKYRDYVFRDGSNGWGYYSSL